ncbi:MAG TPA: 30S ribosomal protein S16 [Candidatus Dormibacteraeota bacterium]|nr:30S ribosomal protein S16 [Candidatus Dormibacteraeota bacterium]
MAVKIRLKRMGAKKRPCYRLVVADARSPRDGRFIEAVGFYDPLTNPATVRVDADRVQHWMRDGARPSDGARALLERAGILPRTVRVPATSPTVPAEPVAAAAPAEPPPAEATPADTAADAVEAEPAPAES